MTSILAAFALLPDERKAAGHNDLACSDLAGLERRFVANRPRRAGRMTRMACIGASGCLAGHEHGEAFGDRLGMFHGSALGNMVETCDVVRQVVEEPEYLPSPIRFSCSMSNMSSFFAAQVTAARGPNLLVSQGEFSFEGALLAAVLALESEECDHALVGATDAYLASRDEHIESLGYSSDAHLGEGSGWLLLGPESPSACGSLLDVELVGGDFDGVPDRIRELAHPEEKIRLVPGPGLSDDDGRVLRRSLPRAEWRPYFARTGMYPTASAAGLAALCVSRSSGELVAHVARNVDRQSSLIVIRVHPA